MSSVTLIAAIGSLAVIAAVLFYLRKGRSTPRCAACGAPSRFGYSKHAESDRKDIVPLCLRCLTTKLGNDYQPQGARALVIEPIANLPCYVFQPNSKWADSKLAQETDAMLSRLNGACRHCEREANFLWSTSQGLSASNFEEVFSEGLSPTLLRWGNAAPYPVCAGCCVNLILKTLEKRDLTFLEVCGPQSENGFVISMGY